MYADGCISYEDPTFGVCYKNRTVVVPNVLSATISAIYCQ